MSEQSSPMDFGIEKTSSLELSEDELFSAFNSVTANPKDVKKIEKLSPEEEAKKKEEEEKKGEAAPKPGEVDADEILGTLEEEDIEDLKKKSAASVKPSATKKEEEEAPKDEEEEIPSESDTPFESITKELFDLGVFTPAEDGIIPEINSGEEFLKLFQEEKRKGSIEMVENILSRHGEDKRELFDAVILKGVDPKTYLEKYVQLENLKDADIASEEVQEKVMREELRAQGWEDGDIKDEIEKVKSYGDLETAAKRYHKSLIKRTESQMASEKQRKEDEANQEMAQQEEYRKNITTIMNAKIKEKEFDGIPVSPVLANKTLDFIYTKKWRLPSGETITDFDNYVLKLRRPENHALKVKMGLLLQLMETDPSLSTIKKKAISSESSSLFSELEKKKTKKTGAVDTTKKPEAVSSWFS